MAQVAVRQYEEEEHLQDVNANQTAVEGSDHTDINAEQPTKTVEESQEEEVYYHYTVDTKDPDPWLKVHK